MFICFSYYTCAYYNSTLQRDRKIIAIIKLYKHLDSKPEAHSYMYSILQIHTHNASLHSVKELLEQACWMGFIKSSQLKARWARTGPERGNTEITW